MAARLKGGHRDPATPPSRQLHIAGVSQALVLGPDDAGRRAVSVQRQDPGVRQRPGPRLRQHRTAEPSDYGAEWGAGRTNTGMGPGKKDYLMVLCISRMHVYIFITNRALGVLVCWVFTRFSAFRPLSAGMDIPGTTLVCILSSNRILSIPGMREEVL